MAVSLLALWLAAVVCAAPSGARDDARLQFRNAADVATLPVSVTPRVGRTRTHFAVSVTISSMQAPSTMRRYQVSVQGPSRFGCTSQASASTAIPKTFGLFRSTNGTTATLQFRLAPHGRWCRGIYHGTVDEVEGVGGCGEGMSHLCPFAIACPLPPVTRPQASSASPDVGPTCPRFGTVVVARGTFRFRVR